MDRRGFVGGVVALGALGAAERSLAQATPVTDLYIQDFARFVALERIYTRYAEIVSPGLDLLVSGELLNIDAWGVRFASVEAAQAGPEEMVRAYEQWMTEARSARVGDVRQVSSRQLGDESWGWGASITNAGAAIELSWALFAVRKDATVQILIGAAASGSTVSRLAAVSEGYIERWPNADRSTGSVNDRRGNLWDTLPQLRDLPEGMSIEYSHDATPDFR